MRKSVVAGTVLAVAAGAWAGAPYATGMWAEQAFRANLKALSGHPQVAIELTAYERGWRHSRAASRLTLKAPERAITFRLQHQIEHGPTLSLPALARVTTTPTITAERARTVAHYFGDKAPLKSQVRIGFTGAQHLTFASPAYHGPAHHDDNLRVDWQGLNGEADIGASGDRVNLELAAPGLAIAGEEGKVAISGLSARSGLTRQADHLWVGDSRMAVNKVTLDVPNTEEGGRIRGHIRRISAQSAITDGNNGDLLRVNAGWGFEQAELDGRTFADGALALELRNIDKAAYRELQERASQLQSGELAQEELARKNLALLQELLPRFLARSPELAITRLSLETDDGRLAGTAEATYRGDRQAESLPANPSLLLQRVTAHARLTLDKPLLSALLRATAENTLAAKEGIDPEQARQMAPRVAEMRLGMLQGMGILVAEDGRYTMAASWEEGSLTVNGRPLGTGMGGGQGPVPGGGPATP